MRSDQRGFTLVELLIAVLLLVVLTAILYDGLNVATRHLGHAAGQRDRSSQVALVQSFLRAQLADAQPFATVDGTAVTVAFAGSPDHLSFVSPAPPGDVRGGLQITSIAVSAAGGPSGGGLAIQWRPYRDTVDDASAATSHALLSQVRQAAFAYFGSTAPNQPPEWHDSWEEMSDLPQLVRLSLVFSDGQVMPELIIALRLASGIEVLRTGRE